MADITPDEFQQAINRAAAEAARSKPRRVRYIARPGEPAFEAEPLLARRVASGGRPVVAERPGMSNLPPRKGSCAIPQMGSTPQGQIVRRVGKP